MKMARSVWSLHTLLFIIAAVCFYTLLLTSAKEISSNGIKRISAEEWEKALNEHPELREIARVADNGEIHPYVHSRNRRTIGRVFDMFRGLFDRIFGGKKGGGGGGYGPPKRPSASYGPPKKKKPASYGPPKTKKPSYGPKPKPNYGAPKPGYGAPGPQPRPPAPRPPAPRPPRPQPPRPRPPGPPRQRPARPQAPVNPGYGGPRPSQPAPGGYGGPQAPRQPTYGGGQQAQQQPNNLDDYGSPQAPVVGGGDIDGYGSPQAPVVGGGDIDGYGSPQAPAIGGGDIDGYGSPQAPVVGGGDLDGYGSPRAPVVGGGSLGAPQAPVIGSGVRNTGQYRSPTAPVRGRGQPNYGGGQQPFRGAPQPSIGPSIQLSVGAPFPAAPVSNSGLPTSNSLADSVFRMIPAPNLATESPTAVRGNVQGSQDSYGSPQGAVIRGGGSQQAPDSYASPQGPVIGGGDIRQAPDSYDSPQAPVIGGGGAPQTPRVNPSSAVNNYGSPVAPTASSNPFIVNSAPPLSVYTSQATFTNQAAGNIIIGKGKAPSPTSGANIITIGNSAVSPPASFGSPQPNSNIDSYGSPVAPSVGPITDIDLPSVIPEAVVVPGVEPRVEPVAAAAPKDVYGSPVAPVGTSAPVPQDVLKQIENNSPEFGLTSDDHASPSGTGSAPEGELVQTTVEEYDTVSDDVDDGGEVDDDDVDSYDSPKSSDYQDIEEEVIDELVKKIQTELDDPTLIKDPEDEQFLNEVITNLKKEKDVVNTIEYLDPSGGGSGLGSPTATGGDNQDGYGVPTDLDGRGNAIDDEPLFDNVRDTVFDPPATVTPGPTIDLGGGFVDLSNGVLSGSSQGESTASEINLTGTTTPASVDYEATTQVPEVRDYEDTYDDTTDQSFAATTIQPQYEDNEEYEYQEDDEDEAPAYEVDDDGDDGDYGEGEPGYNIQPPDNPLDSKLSEDLCANAFIRSPDAGCILYDDEYCDGQEGSQAVMGDGKAILDAQATFDVESISVRAGCQLTVYTGTDLDGTSHIYAADTENLHVTFQDETEELLQAFDDNVNSASCNCGASNTPSEYDDEIAGSGEEYSDIGEEYENGDYDVNNNIEYSDDEEEDIEEEEDVEPIITTARPSLISIPLVIEEKDKDVQVPQYGGDPTVILAGTDEERKPDTLYGGPIDGYEDEAELRKARQTNANSPAHSQGVRISPPKSFQYVEPPQTKRQVKANDLPVTRLLSGRGGQDWSQRLRERQRQRIWRQFNLDRRQGRVYFSQNSGA